jgi:hypothetical protein
MGGMTPRGTSRAPGWLVHAQVGEPKHMMGDTKMFLGTHLAFRGQGSLDWGCCLVYRTDPTECGKNASQGKGAFYFGKE